eukprot:CAMPEP_0178765496 /NCGR_PEP_ID=MMETSP0744-20121128/18484_1 /TAXON_ID=913974 /ORGANISM="Nitzschia punctata, Strain CCMP561" /LENGTH=421 /DNA_ID=CAMNT_0020420999 /DNA_START=30 /DNA_END=1295 /DNA_ORIENTATION=-
MAVRLFDRSDSPTLNYSSILFKSRTTVAFILFCVLAVTTYQLRHEVGLLSSAVSFPSLRSSAAAEAATTDARVSSCLEVRGKSGQWVYRNDSGWSYKTPIRVDGAGKADIVFRSQVRGNTAGMTFLPVTSWMWNEDSDCEIHRLKGKDEFCRVVFRRLKIRRLFFVGDSLTYMFLESMWKLLGHTDDPGKQFAPFHRTIDCGNGVGSSNASTSQFLLDVAYVRNDFLTNQTQKKGCPSPELNKDGLCNAWFHEYSNGTSDKTLLIVNTGLHVHGQATFEQVFDDFVDTIEDSHRTNDIIVYRTAVPGHEDCRQFNAPLSNYSQYRPSTKYDWDKVEGYNRYAVEKIFNLTKNPYSTNADGETSKMNWMVLDVYPMTVLRPDGHRPPRDCLHYYLPGPPDWWTHLLFSNLMDLPLPSKESDV